MTVERLVRVLQQGIKNGEGQQEIKIEVQGKDGFSYYVELDMYHSARNLKNPYYVVHPKVCYNCNCVICECLAHAVIHNDNSGVLSVLEVD